MDGHERTEVRCAGRDAEGGAWCRSSKRRPDRRVSRSRPALAERPVESMHRRWRCRPKPSEYGCAACSLRPEPSVAEVDAAIPDLLLDAPTHVLIEDGKPQDSRSLPARPESRREMSDPVHTIPPPLPVADPKCPKCNITLQFAHKLVTTASRSVISMLWCSACGHLLNVQWVGETPKEQAGPRLIVPN